MKYWIWLQHERDIWTKQRAHLAWAKAKHLHSHTGHWWWKYKNQQGLRSLQGRYCKKEGEEKEKKMGPWENGRVIGTWTDKYLETKWDRGSSYRLFVSPFSLSFLLQSANRKKRSIEFYYHSENWESFRKMSVRVEQNTMQGGIATNRWSVYSIQQLTSSSGETC